MKTIDYGWLKEQPAATSIEVNDVGEVSFYPTQTIKVGDSVILKMVNGALKAGTYFLWNKGNSEGDPSSKQVCNGGGGPCAIVNVSTPSNIVNGFQMVKFKFLDDISKFTPMPGMPSVFAGDKVVLITSSVTPSVANAPSFLITPESFFGGLTVQLGTDAPQMIVESVMAAMCVIIPYLVIDIRVVGNGGYASFIQFANRTLTDAKVSMDAIVTDEGCTKSLTATKNNAFTIPAQSILIVRQEDLAGYLAIPNTELWRVALTLYIDTPDDNGVDVVVWQLGPQMRTVAPCYYNGEKRTWV